MLDRIFPPDGDEKKLRNWRVKVAVGLVALFLMFWGFAALSFGGFSALGADGFALADEVPSKTEVAELSVKVDNVETQVQEISRKQDKSEITELRRSLIEARREICSAQKEGRSQDFWLSREAALQTDYFSATGTEFKLPTCHKMGF